MSAKRQAHERHQFTVDRLLRAYSSRLGVTEAEGSVKNKPAPRTKSKQSRASSTARARGSSAAAGA
jgi:hypothetical protein